MPAAVSAQNTVAFGTMAQDTSLPVEVTAENLSVDQEKGTAIFTGDVVIVQGEMRLAAPWVLVVYSEDQSKVMRLEAKNGVTLVSGPDAAEAERADYSIESGVVVMRGNVLLTQGKNALTANEMTVNLTDGTAQMGGRVKTILQPDAGKN
ncbi:MAG: lipopolysaccharide transport periplasmic protein LptA [Rhodobacteraceae bacterium]|nr:lipopolysaccharide transport periplasmic protein LptA [Paracoccaceae bacterium]